MGIGIDILCLSSKLQILPDFLLDDVSGSFSAISIIEITIIGTMFASVLGYVAYELWSDFRDSFCVKAEENKHKKRKIFFSLLNKVLPLESRVDDDKKNK